MQTGKRKFDLNKVVNRLNNLIIVISVFAGPAYLSVLQASVSENAASSSAKISEEDEQLIDKFLDDTLGIDPAKIAAQKAQPSNNAPDSASGFSLSSGYGIEKNVLNSSWLNLESSKFYTAADFYYTRRRNRVNSLNVYVFLDNTHYPDLEVESDKREFFTRAQGKIWITESNALGVGLSYWQQLSFDADSAVENEPIPKYTNEEYIVAPSWEKDFGDNYFFITELELLNKRTHLPTDDFDRIKLVTRLKKKYGRGSETRVTLDSSKSMYVEGENLDLEGFSVEDTLLEIESQSLGLYNRHSWSASSGLRLKSQLVFLTQKDNGPGYYNYDYGYLGETFQFQLAEWNFSSTLRYSYYQYTKRKALSVDGDAEDLFNSIFEVDAKLEKNFGDNLLLKLEALSLESASNDLDKVYTSDSILLGVIWFF